MASSVMICCWRSRRPGRRLGKDELAQHVGQRTVANAPLLDAADAASGSNRPPL